MKYGLMYYKATDNIGDDIQTYAAIKYLPHIDYYIDRESLSCFVPRQKEYVSMIMNGWFIHNKLAWPPSPYINPLLISMHFKDLVETDVGDMYLKGYGGDFLKKYGPVGARDTETVKRLEKNEIEAYFSGCMTLTIDKFPKVRKKKKICLVDVGQEVEQKVKQSSSSKIYNVGYSSRAEIENLKQNSSYEIETLTHFLNQSETEKKSVQDRMEDVKNLLKKYQEAKLVITTRLHVALPCVALGTPVIVLHKEVFDEDRLGTYFNLFMNYAEEEFLKMDISNLLNNPKSNSCEYLKIRKLLDKTCKDFIRKCEKIEQYSECYNMAVRKIPQDYKIGHFANLNQLPETAEYEDFAEKLMWYKAIYEKERLIVEKIEHKRVQEYNLYHKTLENIYIKIKE